MKGYTGSRSRHGDRQRHPLFSVPNRDRLHIRGRRIPRDRRVDGLEVVDHLHETKTPALFLEPVAVRQREVG